MIKVNDIVIGNSKASCYGITSVGVKCKVINIGDDHIRVVLVGGADKSEYSVLMECFEKYTKILSKRVKYKEWIRRIE